MDESSLFSAALVILSNAWNAVYSWTTNLFNSTSATFYIIAAIMSMLIIRFTVYPFLKVGISGASDRATDKIAYKIKEGSKNHIGF